MFSQGAYGGGGYYATELSAIARRVAIQPFERGATRRRFHIGERERIRGIMGKVVVARGRSVGVRRRHRLVDGH